MHIGFGELILLLLFGLALILSFAREQRLAHWISGVGIVLFLYLAVSVVFDLSFPYKTWNVSIYLIFFLSLILFLSGGFGLIYRIYRGRKPS